MTTDLDRLIEAVEAERLTRQMCEEFFPERHEHPDEDPANHMSAAYHGSLDAAKVLHEALLLGWKWGAHEPSEGVTRVYVTKRSVLRPMPETCEAADPARAWLLAILKAYRSAL